MMCGVCFGALRGPFFMCLCGGLNDLVAIMIHGKILPCLCGERFLMICHLMARKMRGLDVWWAVPMATFHTPLFLCVPNGSGKKINVNKSI